MKTKLRAFGYVSAWLVTMIMGMMVVPTIQAGAGKNGPKVGTPPPPLVLREVLQGPALDEITWDKLRGKVVVLEFWNTRCSPCVASIPHMNKLVDQFASKPVVFLSVSDDNPDHLRTFLKSKPMRGWVAVDGPITATASAYDVRAIPHLLVVDRKGIISGFCHPAKLKAEHLEEILAGKPSSLPPPQVIADEELDSDSVMVESQHKILEVSIRGPFPQPDGAFNMTKWDEAHTEFTAEKASLPSALARFFGVSENEVLGATLLPEELYDLHISAPTNRSDRIESVFAEALEGAFGFSAQVKEMPREIYSMRIVSTDAPGLKPGTSSGGGGSHPGGFRLKAATMNSIADFLTLYLGRTVLDDTGSTNYWQAELNWPMTDSEQLPSVLYKQLDRKTVEQVFKATPDNPLSADRLQTVKARLASAEYELLIEELAKPAEQRFQVAPEVVIAAARKELGLELVLTNRMLKVVEVSRRSKSSDR